MKKIVRIAPKIVLLTLCLAGSAYGMQVDEESQLNEERQPLVVNQVNQLSFAQEMHRDWNSDSHPFYAATPLRAIFAGAFCVVGAMHSWDPGLKEGYWGLVAGLGWNGLSAGIKSCLDKYKHEVAEGTPEEVTEEYLLRNKKIMKQNLVNSVLMPGAVAVGCGVASLFETDDAQRTALIGWSGGFGAASGLGAAFVAGDFFATRSELKKKLADHNKALADAQAPQASTTEQE